MGDVFKIDNMIFTYRYRMSISYTTKRGNKKERLIEVKALSEEGARQALFIYVQSFNAKNGCRSMGNVEILSIDRIDSDIIAL